MLAAAKSRTKYISRADALTVPAVSSPSSPTLERVAANRSPSSKSAGLGTLGIITGYAPSLTDPEDIVGIGSQEILRSLERSFTGDGGCTRTYNLVRQDGLLDTVPNAIESLIRQGVDSIAVIGVNNDHVMGDVRIPAWLQKKIPIVHISGQSIYQSGVHVYCNDRQAGAQAVDHLLSIGCRRIVFLAPFFTPWIQDRLEGARASLKQSKGGPSKLQIHPLSGPLAQWPKSASLEIDKAIVGAVHSVLNSDGVIASSDVIAHQLIRAASRCGKVVGKDFALIGFDDIPRSTFEGLTSLRPPFQEMGREASRLIVRLLTGDSISLQLCLPYYLVVRRSRVLTLRPPKMLKLKLKEVRTG